MRNSVILMAQIDTFREQGLAAWPAVVEATSHRLRPIMRTAAAASLGMIPIARQVFWGPMAFAMIGGIIVATVLTLLFLPALYIVWLRVKPPPRDYVPQHLTAAGTLAASVPAAAAEGVAH